MTNKEKATFLLEEIVRLANTIETLNDFTRLNKTIYKKAGYNKNVVKNISNNLSTYAKNCINKLNNEVQQSNSNSK